MVEVFKTNVQQQDHATMLVNLIHTLFRDYKVNFDLEDCDNILRVECITGNIEPSAMISLLRNFGFHAEVLSDELPYTFVDLTRELYMIKDL